MGTFRAVFAMQCQRLYTRDTLRCAAAISLLIVVGSLVESSLRFYGADLSEVPSAAVGWVGNADSLQIQTMRVFYFFLIFLIAALPFADSFFVDMKSGMTSIIAIRSCKRSYVVSTALVSFLGGFLVVFLALMISQLLALVVFPVVSAPNAFSGTINTSASDGTWALEYAHNALFPSVYVNHPYLNNAVFIIYASIWSGIMSIASFAVSLFTRKSRLIVIGVPTLIYLISSYVLPRNLAIPYYLYPMVLVKGLSQVFFFAAPLLVLAMIIGSIAIALCCRKDVLL